MWMVALIVGTLQQSMVHWLFGVTLFVILFSIFGSLGIIMLSKIRFQKINFLTFLKKKIDITLNRIIYTNINELLIILIVLSTELFLGIVYLQHSFRTALIESQQRYTYTQVKIKQKLNDKTFIVQPTRMEAMKVDLCQNPIVDWYPGEELKDWTFEQLPKCKRVLVYHEN